MFKKYLPALAALSLLICNPAVAATSVPDGEPLDSTAKQRMAAPTQMKTMDDLQNWMTYYYLHPQPEFIPEAIGLADKNQLLDGDHLQLLQAFISRVFAANPDRVKDWYLKTDMSEPNRVKVLTAIWWADTVQGKEMLGGIANGLPAKPQAEFRKQIDGKPPVLETMGIDAPVVLDMLWAAFSATGDEKYVKRIISVLPGAEDKKNLTKQVLASAATWSLKSNAQQHPLVMKLVRDGATGLGDPAAKPYLAKLLTDLEPKAEQAAKPDSPTSATTASSEPQTTPAPADTKPVQEAADSKQTPDHTKEAGGKTSQ